MRTDIPSSELRYIALIQINGDNAGVDKDNVLGELNNQLKSYYPTSIDPKTVTGFQTVHYGLMKTYGNAPIRFTIDNQQFNTQEATSRQLALDSTEEWTLIAKNDYTFKGQGPSHPFHIHVNPFEVFSIVDKQGNEKLKVPVWKDTLILNEGEKNRFRTTYTDFIGLFVQHCHILDNTHCFDPKQHLQRTTVVFLFEKPKCFGCSKQISSYAAEYEKFQAQGIDVLGISSPKGSPKELFDGLKDRNIQFPMLVDKTGKAFLEFGSMSGLHGTFIVSKSGLIKYQHIATGPFDNIDDVLEKAIQVRDEEKEQ